MGHGSHGSWVKNATHCQLWFKLNLRTTEIRGGGAKNAGHEIAGHEITGHAKAKQKTSSKAANV